MKEPPMTEEAAIGDTERAHRERVRIRRNRQQTARKRNPQVGRTLRRIGDSAVGSDSAAATMK